MTTQENHSPVRDETYTVDGHEFESEPRVLAGKDSNQRSKRPSKAKSQKRNTRKPKGVTKKRRGENFATYIYRVHQAINPDLRMSQGAVAILNSFVLDIFERLASTASEMLKFKSTGGSTMTSADIESALALVVRGSLAHHGRIEGIKALRRYNASRT